MEIGKKRINSFTELDVYKRSFNAALKAQIIINILRANREYDLADQMSRCTKAVPALIAKATPKDTNQNISKNILTMQLVSRTSQLFT